MGKYSKMSTFAGAILGLLGLKEWKKAEDKDILDADDVVKLKELGFDEKFIIPFGEALKNGFKDEEQQAGPVENSGEALIRGLLAQKVSEMASLQEPVGCNKKDRRGKDAGHHPERYRNSGAEAEDFGTERIAGAGPWCGCRSETKYGCRCLQPR